MADSNSILTPEFRVSFASVFRPQKSKDKPDEDGQYEITCLFPHPSQMTPKYKQDYDVFSKRLKAEVDRVIEERWGKDKSKHPSNLRLPFHDQGEKTYDGYVPGALYFKAKSYSRPGLVDGRNNDIIDETEFYSGCYARCTLRVKAYPKAGGKDYGNRGVRIELHNIQKLRDGEPLSGRLKAQDEFEPVASAEEPAAVGAGGAMDLLN